MDEDDNNVCPTEMLVDLTLKDEVIPAFKLCSKSEFTSDTDQEKITKSAETDEKMLSDLTMKEEEVAPVFKLCNKFEFTSNTDQEKIAKNAVIEKMHKCIKDMDQCIMDMSPARLKAECTISQVDYVDTKQDEKMDATAGDCPVGILVDLPSAEVNDSKDFHARSMTGDGLKKSSVNDGSSPLTARKNQLSVARQHCKIPSPRSMSHISKGASVVINNINTTFIFDENVILTEEVLPIPINFDLDDPDPDDNSLNIEENISKTEVLNNKTSIATQMKDISVSTESVEDGVVDNEDGVIDEDPEYISSTDKNICKTGIINIYGKTSIAAKTKDISVGTKNFEESVINNPDNDGKDTEDNLSRIGENICKSEVLNNKTTISAQEKAISVGTGRVGESVINSPLPDVLQCTEIKSSGTLPAEKESEIIKEVKFSPCKLSDSIESSEFHFAHDELDDVFAKENLHSDKIETELSKVDQKHGEIAPKKYTSKLKFNAHEALKNLSNIRFNITGTGSLTKSSPNIKNNAVMPTQFPAKPFSHGKTQLKKTVSAIEPRNASEISYSLKFPSKSKFISNLQKQSSIEQEASLHKSSGMMQPKTISQKSSTLAPSRRYSMTTPIKNVGLKPPSSTGISRCQKSSLPRFTPQTGSRLSFSKSLQLPGHNLYSSGSRGLRQPNPSSLRKSEPSEEKPSFQNVTTPPNAVKKFAALSTSSKIRTCSKLSMPSPLPTSFNKNIARELFPPNSKRI